MAKRKPKLEKIGSGYYFTMIVDPGSRETGFKSKGDIVRGIVINDAGSPDRHNVVVDLQDLDRLIKDLIEFRAKHAQLDYTFQDPERVRYTTALVTLMNAEDDAQRILSWMGSLPEQYRKTVPPGCLAYEIESHRCIEEAPEDIRNLARKLKGQL